MGVVFLLYFSVMFIFLRKIASSTSCAFIFFVFDLFFCHFVLVLNLFSYLIFFPILFCFDDDNVNMASMMMVSGKEVKKK